MHYLWRPNTLAAIAKKDEALIKLDYWIEELPAGTKGATKYGCIVDAAIAMKPGDVKLVEVGSICYEDTLVGVDLTNTNIKNGDKVYSIQTKSNTE